MQEHELLTLAAVAADPELITTELSLLTGERITFRPLLPDDETGLTTFLENLSSQTRRFYVCSSYDRIAAIEMCRAINRYDKLRMVVVIAECIIALFEFSLAIPDSDLTRYKNYGIALDAETDIRFGPCIIDKYQNHGLGSRLFPLVVDIARRFRKKRMILWGGVFIDNQRAIHYYEKNGFQIMGEFLDDEGRLCCDAIVEL